MEGGSTRRRRLRSGRLSVHRLPLPRRSGRPQLAGRSRGIVEVLCAVLRYRLHRCRSATVGGAVAAGWWWVARGELEHFTTRLWIGKLIHIGRCGDEGYFDGIRLGYGRGVVDPCGAERRADVDDRRRLARPGGCAHWRGQDHEICCPAPIARGARASASRRRFRQGARQPLGSRIHRSAEAGEALAPERDPPVVQPNAGDLRDRAGLGGKRGGRSESIDQQGLVQVGDMHVDVLETKEGARLSTFGCCLLAVMSLGGMMANRRATWKWSWPQAPSPLPWQRCASDWSRAS
mmetsp:Transcript_125939/g.403211  ORF Transcript_125939/g.403211 Transcript_125939/m.403211 type:complete len:291 (-) Transcript_125939:228-1100(-)